MTRRVAAAALAFGVSFGGAAILQAQDHDDDAPAITARVHGTFIDQAGGAGVLSGDMTIQRFELRAGAVTAVGRIAGALADSKGAVLGLVEQELVLPVGNVESTCNQLRMDLAGTEADILQVRVRFDKETAGFDSRDGATPKALGVLCEVGALLGRKPAPADVAKALDGVAVALRVRSSAR